MAIKFHPKPGQILMCDFTTGFIVPEMVKYRPVVVISGYFKGRADLVTVCPLSTTPPNMEGKHHLLLPASCMPDTPLFQSKDNWLKGDMVYTVGFQRLEPVKIGMDRATGKRIYFTRRLGREMMKDIYGCVLHGLNLGELSKQLRS